MNKITDNANKMNDYMSRYMEISNDQVKWLKKQLGLNTDKSLSVHYDNNKAVIICDDKKYAFVKYNNDILTLDWDNNDLNALMKMNSIAKTFVNSKKQLQFDLPTYKENTDKLYTFENIYKKNMYMFSDNFELYFFSKQVDLIYKNFICDAVYVVKKMNLNNEILAKTII